VTGVQTCALPIYQLGSLGVQPGLKLTAALDSSERPGPAGGVLLLVLLLVLVLVLLPSPLPPPPPPQEISMPARNKAARRFIGRVSVTSMTFVRGGMIRMDARGLTAPASNAHAN